jgi:hypothetical protein
MKSKPGLRADTWLNNSETVFGEGLVSEARPGNPCAAVPLVATLGQLLAGRYQP